MKRKDNHIDEIDIIHGALDGVELCEYATIYVDDASRMAPKTIDLLIAHFANYKRTFVFLG